MSLIEKLTSIKTKLTSVLSDINTALVAKGATEVTSLAEVPTAIESVQSGGENSGGSDVELFDDYESYYTRPSWWLPYPELTEGDNINEIFLLMEVEPDVTEYDGIDLSDTEVLRNGKKQFWKRIEGTQIDGEQPDLLEVYANCVEKWNFDHEVISVSQTTLLTQRSCYYPKLQIISGTPMQIKNARQILSSVFSLKKVDCTVMSSIATSLCGMGGTGIIKAPRFESDILPLKLFNWCVTMLDGGTVGGSGYNSLSTCFQYCRALRKIHFSEPCNTTASTFTNCGWLTDVTVEEGFTGSLFIHHSTRYTSETIHAIIENYADMTGQTAPTFQVGEENLLKIDDEHIAMLNTKNINYS